LLALKSIHRCLKEGYIAETGSHFIVYGIMMHVAFKNLDAAFKYATIGKTIIDKSNNIRLQASSSFAMSSMVYPWKIPYKNCLVHYNKGYQLGLQVGDLLYTSYAAAMIPIMMFTKGD